MSFLIDIPALFFIGIGLVWLRNLVCWRAGSERSPNFLCWFSGLVMLAFWIGALGFYLDLIDLGGCFSPGSRFMWNSCLELLGINLGIQLHPGMHPIAMLLFASYPLWLYFGVSVGRVLFGRRPGQEGWIWILKTKY